MAVYRSARQIPRYRFFGDPPLKEQDDEYLAQRELRLLIRCIVCCFADFDGHRGVLLLPLEVLSGCAGVWSCVVVCGARLLQQCVLPRLFFLLEEEKVAY